MDVEDKIQLLKNLVKRMEKMIFEEIDIALSDFINEGEVILTKIFGEKSRHVKKFVEVSFSMIVSSFDEHIAYSEALYAFNNGKKSIISVLNGALLELNLEKDFSQPLQVTKDTNLESPTIQNNKVFIVHGHDDGLKNEVARFIEKLGFEAIILHEKANEGNTIIEKIEKHSDVGFAIVLYTPCDEGKSIEAKELKSRARQNVVFEHGYFIAKLGRKNVVALHKGADMELPNDISGVVYIKYENSSWKTAIADEMDAAGYIINYKLVR